MFKFKIFGLQVPALSVDPGLVSHETLLAAAVLIGEFPSEILSQSELSLRGYGVRGLGLGGSG